MTRSKSFQTQNHRRRQDPVEWIIDDKPIRLKSSVELAELSEAIDQLQEPMPEGGKSLIAAEERRGILVTMVRDTFVEPDSHKSFNEVSPDLDFKMLSGMIYDLIEEYTGQNPTQEQSSSDRSPAIGVSSTDIAPLEEQTPPVSQPIEP